VIAQSDGARIAYEIRGDGDPVVLVHGLAYDRAGWGPFPDRLAERFRVVLIDNRGVGESDAPDGPYSVPQMAADVIAVMDDAGMERTRLFGVSLGGYIAQELTLTHPERVERLVLCSTAVGGARAVPMPPATQEAFARFPLMEREAGLRMFVENSLGARGVRDLPALVEEIFRYRLGHAPTAQAWMAQAAAGATYVNDDRVSAIAVPTFVLQGGADVVVDPRNAAVLGELIEGARVEVVPDRGHLFVWEDPDVAARIVMEFLSA